MRNATSYAKKVKKLLGKLPDASARPDEEADPIRILVRSVLEADASDKDADRAVAALEEEFLDFNELRASPSRDIVECLGEQLPRAREKGEVLVKVLNGLFRRVHKVSVEYMRDMTKRDLRRHLGELGMEAYASARLVGTVFDGHAIPVDQTLVESLEMGGYVHPESDVADVQGFLERIITHKDAQAAHEALRAYVARSAKALAKKRKAERAAAKKIADAKAAAEAKKKEAEEARKAMKAKKARAVARAAKAKEAAKAKKAKKAKKAAKKAPAEPARKKAKRKVAKRAAAPRRPRKAAKAPSAKKTAKKKTAKKSKRKK